MIFQPWVLQLPAWSTVGRLSSALVRWFVRCLGFLFHTKRLVEHLKIPLLVFPGIMKVNILKNKREWTHEIICQFLSLLGQAMIL